MSVLLQGLCVLHAFSAGYEWQGRSAHAALYQRYVCRIDWPQLYSQKHV